MARKKKSSSVKVNFKGVESRRTPPEGDYVMEVLEANTGKSSAGNDQIEFVCEVAKGEYKGVKGYLYCGLADNVLWKLHAFLTALGEDVPEDEMDIDLTELIGKQFVGVLTHETYNGKKRAKLTDFDSLENYSGKDADDEDEDEDEDDKKSSKKSKAKADAKKSKKSKSDDDDDDDEDEDEAPKKGKSKGKSKSDDDDDDDEDEPKGKKSKGKKSKDDDDDDDDDDEPKSKKGAKKQPKKYDRDDIEDMDEDELEEVIEESGIDVDLDDYKKLKKKVAAVIDALEEADLLEE